MGQRKERAPSLVSASALACPCGGGAYAQCCARFHSGAPAQTAEQLMRARYSAYVLHDNAFIVATWHPTTRPAELSAEDTQATRWLGLEVRRHEQEGEKATVEFVARCRIDGRGQRLHEISRFVHEAGWWWYLDGSFPKDEKK